MPLAKRGRIPRILPRFRFLQVVVAVVAIVALRAPATWAAPVTLGRLAESLTPPDQQDAAKGMDSSLFQASAAPAMLLGGPVDPSSYIMGPGDVLSLERRAGGASSQPLIVDAEGAVYLADLGRRKIAGMTLEAARRSLIAELQRFLPRAQLDLRLVRPRSFKVFIVGETNVPGMVVATAANRAAEAISQRGGLLKSASLRNIELRRAGGAVERVDLQSFLWLGDLEHDPWLADGDRIVIPRVRDNVFLTGPVQHAGFFEFAPGDSLGGLLRLAGGLSPDARLDSILVSRFTTNTESESLWVSAEAGGSLLLRPDDHIFVRRQSPWRPLAVASAEGELRQPGQFPLREGRDRLSDLIRWSGGFTPQASLSNVILIRDSDPQLTDDPDMERLRRLTRAEMTEGEYFDLKARTEGRRTYYQVDLTSGLVPGSRQDIFLRNGDRLTVNSTARTVRVGGEVVRPGMVAYRENLGPREYVDLAGGFGPRASTGDIRVIRTGDGSSVAARDVERLSPGDYVWVPEKPARPPFWSVFKDVVGVGAQLATIILVINSHNNSSSTTTTSK